MVFNDQLSQSEMMFLITGGSEVADEQENPDPSWITEKIWQSLHRLEQMEGFGDYVKSFKDHLAEYKVHQKKLFIKLGEWYANGCDKNGPTLPDKAGQYAVQEPQLGPGKPLEPAPRPIYSPATSPALSVPQAKKPSK